MSADTSAPAPPQTTPIDTNVNGVSGPATAASELVASPSFDPAAATLTLRALVSTKEAGVIIGKGGKNVADLREATGVKAGVSKVVAGVTDRVLTVTGKLDSVAKAYSLVAQTILENPISVSPPTTPVTSPTSSTSTIRLLISHNLMGSIIGKQGMKIKQIQDASGTRMIAGKEMLPQSTERIVELHGTTEGLRVAVWEIGKCLLEDWERGTGTVLYHPGTVGPDGASSTYPGGVLGTSYTSPLRKASSGPRRTTSGSGSPIERRTTNGNGASAASPIDPNLKTQNISIPADMVGCIIGKGGNKINEIRRLSGSKISIAKDAHDESMERMFTITGTAEANEKALFLLYNQLENEKERRMQSAQEQTE